MTEQPPSRHDWNEVGEEQLGELITRRVIMTERVTIAKFHLQAGAVVGSHLHEQEQVTHIEEGLLRFWLGEDESQVHDLAAGEVLVIPSNVPHRALALETTRATDVFCPRREDWLAGTDSYLRGDRTDAPAEPAG